MKTDDDIKLQLRRPLHGSGQVVKLPLNIRLIVFKINGPVPYRDAKCIETCLLNSLKVTLVQERLPMRPQQLRARVLAECCAEMPLVACRSAVVQRRCQPWLGQKPSAQIHAPDLTVCDVEEAREGQAQNGRQALARHGRRVGFPILGSRLRFCFSENHCDGIIGREASHVVLNLR